MKLKLGPREASDLYLLIKTELEGAYEAPMDYRHRLENVERKLHDLIYGGD